MWDLPRPGLEPVSPALADRFSTAAPPGKPLKLILDLIAFPQPENSYGFEVNSQKLNTKQDESFHESVIFISALEH